MRRSSAVLISAVALGCFGAPAAGAAPSAPPTVSGAECSPGHDGPGSASSSLPETISLPNGFQPEGIVFGYGPVLYAGSLADGSIYAANALTGEGGLLVDGEEGRVSVGLGFDDRTGRLYVSGGATGAARVYDAATGTELHALQLASESTFVNDVAIAEDAAWFTDSARPVLYRVPLDDPEAWSEVPLGGDFAFDEGAFNANGIVAAGDGTLIVVHSSRGELYAVDPATGDATLIDLDGGSVPNGDGLVLSGSALYVVQNRANQVAVVHLADDLARGEVVDVLASSLFRVPTTADLFGSSLYLVNARFGTPPGPDVDYDVVRLEP